MGNKRYSDAQLMWLEVNSCSRVWKNRDEFMDEFNATFNCNISKFQFNDLIDYYKIKIVTEQTQSVFTDEQKTWLIENAKSGRFKNCTELTNTYNAVFKQCRKKDNIYSYLHTWGVGLKTNFTMNKLTDEMSEWLIKNYSAYDGFSELTVKFNETFGTNKTETAIAKACRDKFGLRRTKAYMGRMSRERTAKEIGAISERSDGYYIKVNGDNDKTSWIPLKKLVYEKHNGQIPEGKCVIFLDGDSRNLSPENLYCIDRRGTPIMAKLGWWSDNQILTKTGAEWCNLYLTAKDNGILVKGEADG